MKLSCLSSCVWLYILRTKSGKSLSKIHLLLKQISTEMCLAKRKKKNLYNLESEENSLLLTFFSCHLSLKPEKWCSCDNGCKPCPFLMHHHVAALHSGLMKLLPVRKRLLQPFSEIIFCNYWTAYKPERLLWTHLEVSVNNVLLVAVLHRRYNLYKKETSRV